MSLCFVYKENSLSIFIFCMKSSNTFGTPPHNNFLCVCEGYNYDAAPVVQHPYCVLARAGWEGWGVGGGMG